MRKPNIIPYLAALLLITGIVFSAYKSNEVSTKGLKDYYRKYFPIGVAITPWDLSGDKRNLILNQFNSITAENAMKMGPIHPMENTYNWKMADSIAAFARTNGLKLRGHCLVWHKQTPNWLFKGENGNMVSKEILLKRLQEHINTVVNRYKKDIYAWDVVNEVIADDSAYFRKTPLYQIAGEDFVEMAFRYAHQADPKAQLFYNDYNTEQPLKREKIYRMLKSLLAKGVPIHGIGLQGHWSISNPSRSELEKSIALFSSLGLKIQVTELDVSVYSGNQGGRLIQGNTSNNTEQFTPEMEEKQLQQYKMIFEVLRKYKANITGVTFWNLSDRYSWLNNRGQKNYPLLFDQNLMPKKAFFEVTKF
ncbi:endo-1,4-beta-xylanase [Pedobacter sp. PF22-3]|uniref:endo-1,4-beta-xylanase n=1 Tax=Pedobacter sp. PF22-3 TaxID=2994467 RepID=UPI002245FD2D|nr:endo-1,4-beta-xylanase [Pedobacter sp. PF22-3]MCX2492720.1 endo-1,4-beta-xylanase [Pedobacter sp. PF22-3]